VTRLADPRQVRLHRAARAEDRLHAWLARLLRRRGWRPRVIAFTGYGDGTRVRVLGRVLLAPPGTRSAQLRLGRGWRRFLTASVAGVEVTVALNGATHRLTSDRGGYVDAVLPATLDPGWAEARLQVAGSSEAFTPVRVVAPGPGLAVVSDIDDTVIVTALPRPLLAAWNTFVRHESARRPVPGMADLLRQVVAAHDDAPVFYLSTGAWNVAPTLRSFLDRHGYPPGPLLMTDWGPTADGWFRSGRAHKHRELHRLLAELPAREWLLVGDDGQHDPQIYAEVAAAAPGRVRAIAIRELSAGEQVRTHGTPAPKTDPAHRPATGTAEVRAPDGHGLLAGLRDRGLLGS